jgi:hypothetical protein
MVESKSHIRHGGFRVQDSELRQLMSRDLLSTLALSHCSIIHIDT